MKVSFVKMQNVNGFRVTYETADTLNKILMVFNAKDIAGYFQTYLHFEIILRQDTQWKKHAS